MKAESFFLLFASLTAGCAYVSPLVGGFNLISVPQERALGEQAAAQIQQEMKILPESEVTLRVRKIGSRLTAVLPYRQFDYDFQVVQDPAPNAFTIPGGKIYVHTGLLKFASDESEIAGVMAHEIAHAFERHPAKHMSRAYGVDYLSKLLFRGNEGRLQSAILQFAAGGVLSHYGREEELSADSIGHELLARSGYRTDGLIRFFKKLQAMERGGLSIPFLSSHPPTPERIARLEDLEKRRRHTTLAA